MDYVADPANRTGVLAVPPSDGDAATAERIYRMTMNERTGGGVRDLGLGLSLAATARLQEKNLIAKDSLARQEVKKYTDAEFVCDSHSISALESDRP